MGAVPGLGQRCRGPFQRKAAGHRHGERALSEELDQAREPCAVGDNLDGQGHGTVAEQRLYQLIRQPGPVTERTFEITFLDPGVEAYAFTFG